MEYDKNIKLYANVRYAVKYKKAEFYSHLKDYSVLNRSCYGREAIILNL